MKQLSSLDDSSVKAIAGVINDITNVELVEQCHLTFEQVQKAINKKARSRNYYSFEYVGSLVDATYREKEIFLREWFGDGREADFENLKVIIPSNTKEILTQMYGDYMILPPKEKQIPLHDYSAYYI